MAYAPQPIIREFSNPKGFFQTVRPYNVEDLSRIAAQVQQEVGAYYAPLREKEVSVLTPYASINSLAVLYAYAAVTAKGRMENSGGKEFVGEGDGAEKRARSGMESGAGSEKAGGSLDLVQRGSRITMGTEDGTLECLLYLGRKDEALGYRSGRADEVRAGGMGAGGVRASSGISSWLSSRLAQPTREMKNNLAVILLAAGVGSMVGRASGLLGRIITHGGTAYGVGSALQAVYNECVPAGHCTLVISQSISQGISLGEGGEISPKQLRSFRELRELYAEK